MFLLHEQWVEGRVGQGYHSPGCSHLPIVAKQSGVTEVAKLYDLKEMLRDFLLPPGEVRSVP